MVAMQEAVADIITRIAAAAVRGGRRPDEVTLVAATKHCSAALISLYLNTLESLGISSCVIGENYLQEFKGKQESITAPFKAHFIGPLQSNKAKEAAMLFDMVESVGSRKVLRELSKGAVLRATPVEFLLQVNISDDDAKQGFSPQDLTESLFDEIGMLPNIRFRGLMTMTRYYDIPELVRPDFQRFRSLRDEVEPLPSVRRLLESRKFVLSMGMSRDFEIAIEEGADMVRVGTALFGERSQ